MSSEPRRAKGVITTCTTSLAVVFGGIPRGFSQQRAKMYSPNSFFGNASIPISSNQRTASPAGPSLFVPNEFNVATPPSRDISVHQKLDRLLSSNMEQKSAIEDLKSENVALKQQLCAVHSALQAVREVQTAVRMAPQGKMKLPPAISVSLREAITLKHCYTLPSLCRLQSGLYIIATARNNNLDQSSGKQTIK